MGLFGPKIGEIKILNGTQKHDQAYGWCVKCLGLGKRIAAGTNGNLRVEQKDCIECSGKGKKWIKTPKNNPYIFEITEGRSSPDAVIFPFKNIKPTQDKDIERRYKAKYASRMLGNSNCNHDWRRIRHDGGTKNECTRCGVRDHDSWLRS